MAIVEMKRLSVIGLDEVRDDLLADLIDLGIVQITDQKTADEETALQPALAGGGADGDKIARLDQRIADIELALDTLQTYSPEKQPMFFTRRDVDRRAFDAILTRRDTIAEQVDRILQLRDAVHREQEAINKDRTDLASTAPWEAYDIPLEITETAHLDIDLGIMPAAADMEGMRQAAEKVTDLYMMDEIGRDKEFVYYTLVTMKPYTDGLRDIVRQRGYVSVQFRDLRGTIPQIRTGLEADIDARQETIAALEQELTALWPHRDDIQCLHDELIILRDEERIKDRLQTTRRTFCFEGWMPAPAEEAVFDMLDRYGCWREVRAPKEEERPPVLLHNSSLSRPHEAIVEMYSLPDYRGYDPTGWVAVFYTIFFGMMLSDAGYGLIVAVVCGLILHKFNLEGMTRRMWKTFFYGGISSMFWGALFGSWFGNFVEAFSGTFLHSTASIPALWFNPIEDPTRLLLFSLGMGVVHIFIGMGLHAIMMIRDGRWLEALSDDFSWYMVITGGILWGAGAMTDSVPVMAAGIGKWLVIAGAVVLLCTGGRHSRSVFGKIGGGLKAVYSVTSYLSDILSYARLLALGMATSVIAQVMNTIGTLSGGGVKGAIILAVVFLFGHALNMIINLLGAFVHSSRLQYLEFFGKFYVDGGDPFVPYRQNTKYIRIVGNERQGGNRK